MSNVSEYIVTGGVYFFVAVGILLLIALLAVIILGLLWWVGYIGFEYTVIVLLIIAVYGWLA